KKCFSLLLCGAFAFISCSDEIENGYSDNQQAEVEDGNKEVLDVYRVAYNQYAFKKDNPMFDQSEINDLIFDEAESLLETFGEPKDFHVENNDSQEEIIIQKSFERYVELTLIKKIN